jgi:uroporphyrinogen decarboxylase
MAALNFQETDRVPKDLGGMLSTSISAFAYPKLVEALGLPYRRPRVYDTNQMLAMPDMDVLDALGCDIVAVFNGATNGIDEPDKWQDYDFNGRLKAAVRDKSIFKDHEDGTITQPQYKIKMPTTSTVFDEAHGGQPLNLSMDLPKPDLKEAMENNKKNFPTDEQIKDLIDLCKRTRESTDKAIFVSGPIYSGIAITAPGGLAVWPMVCMTEPNFVNDYHGMMAENAIKMTDAIMPELAPYIDVMMLAADDWGTQNNLIAPPRVFEELFLPHLKKINERVHKYAPEVKTFLHCCGAVYDIIDMVIESGFDILNPAQWPAGGKSYTEWKDKARNRISFWGGGVNAQHTLPLGTVQDIEKEVAEIVQYLKQDGGYVFNSIHNILAEIEPEKIIAMYKSAQTNG